MNILITRPLIDAEDLMGKLLTLGHKIIHLPTLKIIPAKIDPINVKKYNAFIFTSANAIRNLKVIEQDKNKFCSAKVCNNLPPAGTLIVFSGSPLISTVTSPVETNLDLASKITKIIKFTIIVKETIPKTISIVSTITN